WGLDWPTQPQKGHLTLKHSYPPARRGRGRYRAMAAGGEVSPRAPNYPWRRAAQAALPYLWQVLEGRTLLRLPLSLSTNFAFETDMLWCHRSKYTPENPVPQLGRFSLERSLG